MPYIIEKHVSQFNGNSNKFVIDDRTTSKKGFDNLHDARVACQDNFDKQLEAAKNLAEDFIVTEKKSSDGSKKALINLKSDSKNIIISITYEIIERN